MKQIITILFWLCLLTLCSLTIKHTILAINTTNEIKRTEITNINTETNYHFKHPIYRGEPYEIINPIYKGEPYEIKFLNNK